MGSIPLLERARADASTGAESSAKSPLRTTLELSGTITSLEQSDIRRASFPDEHFSYEFSLPFRTAATLDAIHELIPGPFNRGPKAMPSRLVWQPASRKSPRSIGTSISGPDGARRLPAPRLMYSSALRSLDVRDKSKRGDPAEISHKPLVTYRYLPAI